MGNINITSEIGKLKKVLLHRPGRELLNLTPNNMKELLFDDIPFLKEAGIEHDEFARVLKENKVEVVYLEDLMSEVIKTNPNIREKFIKQYIEEANIGTKKYKDLAYKYLSNIEDPKKLVLKTMEGIRIGEIDPNYEKKVNLIDYLEDREDIIISPMPNLYFARDNVAPVGNGVVINHMHTDVRNRENIYGEYIFKYHKDYKDIPQYYGRNNKWSIEGGDVLNISENLLIIGVSERTEPSAVDELAKNLMIDNNTNIKTILAFEIPRIRSYMHLDTVFTQVDKYTFVYHPAILDVLQVFEIKKNNNEIEVLEVQGSLKEVLDRYLGHDVTLIPCAGGDKVASSREQWNDGANTLCLSPGVVIVYDINVETNNELRKAGIRVIEIRGSELGRGRGGPRCMSMPLFREDI